MTHDDSEKIYFTNNLEDLDFVKICLKENVIPFEIVFNNNSHPIFGTNLSQGMDSVLYKYAVKVSPEYCAKAQALLKEVLEPEGNPIEEEVSSQEEEKLPLAEEKKSRKSPAGMYILLLFIQHYSRYFAKVRQEKFGRGKTILLNLLGLFWLFLNLCSLILMFVGPYNINDYYYVLAACSMVFLFASGYEAVLNIVDYFIERKKSQKIWANLSLLIFIAVFVLVQIDPF